MPHLVAGALVAAAGISGTAALIATGVLGTALSIGMAYGAQALFGKKPETPNYSTAQRERTQVIRSSVAPRRVVYGEAKTSGPLVFAASTGEKKEYIHLVIPLAGHEVESIGDIYFNDEPITEAAINTQGEVYAGKFANFARIKKHSGHPDQLADPDLVAEVAQWTNAHRLRGVAYIYVRLKWDAEIYPTGIPNISAVVRGRRVYDPRTRLTEWSDNFALCVRDYLTNDHGLAAREDELHANNFIASANISDEPIQTDRNGGSQRRYTLNGVIFLDEKPISIMESMLTAGMGATVYQGGQYRVFPGAYRTPQIELTADDLRDAIRVRPRMQRQELFNRVRGTYISPENYWQASDFPPVANPLYVQQDNGETITKDVDLPFTTDSIRAQRIAKMVLERSRQGITVEFPAKSTAYQVEVMRPVMLTIDRLGWDKKVFLPLGWKYNPVSGGVDIVLQEEAPAVYNWNFGEALTYDPAPDTNLPDPWDVAPPGNVQVYNATVQIADGTTQPAIRITWDLPADAFVLEYEVQWAEVGTTNWNSYTTRRQRHEAIAVTGRKYMARVRSFNIRGTPSPWAYYDGEFTAQPDTTAPGPVTNLTASENGVRQISLHWTNPGDLDLDVAEIWESPTNSQSTAYKQGESNADYFVRSGLDPREVRYYWVRWRDRSKNLGPFQSAAGVRGQASDLIATDIADGIVNTAKLASGLALVELVNGLPTLGNREGRIVLNQATGKLHRFVNGAWTAWMDGRDLGDGTIPYGKLAVGAVRANEIATGELRARHMAAETIISQAIQVGAGVIGNVHIGNAVITRAKIGIAEIDTLRLAGGAATAGNAGEHGGGSYGTGWTTFAGVGLTTTGAPVYVFATGQLSAYSIQDFSSPDADATPTTSSIRILRDSVLDKTGQIDVVRGPEMAGHNTAGAAPSVRDVVPAGYHYWHIQCYNNGLGQSYGRIGRNTIFAIELRR